MSLLKAIEEAKAVVSSLEALLGESVSKKQVGPWYLNIPKEGVKCWIGDSRKEVRGAVGAGHNITTVYNYDTNCDHAPFSSMYSHWKYAVPIDPKLRLPNGAIVL